MTTPRTIRANVLSFLPAAGPVTNGDLPVPDLALPVSSLFPLVVQDEEQLKKTDIRKLKLHSLLIHLHSHIVP